MNDRSPDGFRRHFTYANVMSTLSVFLVIAGGTALAAKDSVSSKGIKDNSIVSKDLKDGAAVASSDVIDNSLTGDDIDEGKLNLPATPSSLPPSGPAGGGLAGTYPNPAIGVDAVNSANVADNALTGNDVDESSLVFPSPPGTNPSGPAGGGLSGTYPNPTIGANAVGSAQVSTDSLTDADLATNSVKSDEVATDAVGGAAIAADAVSSDELASVAEVASTPVTIASHGAGEATAVCPSGWQLLSGGGVSNGGVPTHNFPSASNAWTYYVENTSSLSVSVTAHALCLSP